MLRAIHRFYEAPRPGEVYNLGGGRENSCSILEAADARRGAGRRRGSRPSTSTTPRRGDHICYISDLAQAQDPLPGLEDRDLAARDRSGDHRQLAGARKQRADGMRILVTGICGFVGSHVAERSSSARSPTSRSSGSTTSVGAAARPTSPRSQRLGCRSFTATCASPMTWPSCHACDWVIDCAAIPSVLAGIRGGTAQLVGHNLWGRSICWRSAGARAPASSS